MTQANSDIDFLSPRTVDVVDAPEALDLVAVPTERVQQLHDIAAAYVAELLGLEAQSPAFDDKIDAIAKLAADEVRTAAEASAAIAVRSTLGVSGRGAQVEVAQSLAELRSVIHDLDPNDIEAKGPVEKFLRLRRTQSGLEAYFDRYQNALPQLHEVLRKLERGQDDLRKDNAAIEGNREQFRALLEKMTEYIALASALDGEIMATAATGPAAERLRSDVLIAVRQRHQDLLTQIVVSAQGYLSFDLVQQTNVELVRAVERARSVTLAAMLSAARAAEGLGIQQQLVQQISAVSQSAAALASAPDGDRMAALQVAFHDLGSTLEAVDRYQAESSKSLDQSASAFETQLRRAGVATDAP